jgi:CRISPR-associated protein Cas2
MRCLNLSGYQGMWLFAMFDLPVETALNRRDYSRFRKALLKDGFIFLQYSVYARYIMGEEAAQAHRSLVRRALPPEGQVRLLAVTDHQFGKMEVFHAKKPKPAEEAPLQFMLF